jgi:hypothetical protein
LIKSGGWFNTVAVDIEIAVEVDIPPIYHCRLSRVKNGSKRSAV